MDPQHHGQVCEQRHHLMPSDLFNAFQQHPRWFVSILKFQKHWLKSHSQLQHSGSISEREITEIQNILTYERSEPILVCWGKLWTKCSISFKAQVIIWWIYLCPCISVPAGLASQQERHRAWWNTRRAGCYRIRGDHTDPVLTSWIHWAQVSEGWNYFSTQCLRARVQHWKKFLTLCSASWRTYSKRDWWKSNRDFLTWTRSRFTFLPHSSWAVWQKHKSRRLFRPQFPER